MGVPQTKNSGMGLNYNRSVKVSSSIEIYLMTVAL